MKNRVNLCAKIRSISSACLILILTRIELIEGSMRTCSFSLRAICIGFNMISGEVLYISISSTEGNWHWVGTWLRLLECCVVPRLDLRSSQDIKQLSNSLGHNSSMAVMYSTTSWISISHIRGIIWRTILSKLKRRSSSGKGRWLWFGDQVLQSG